jgi:hypothetical protein
VHAFIYRAEPCSCLGNRGSNSTASRYYYYYYQYYYSSFAMMAGSFFRRTSAAIYAVVVGLALVMAGNAAAEPDVRVEITHAAPTKAPVTRDHAYDAMVTLSIEQPDGSLVPSGWSTRAEEGCVSGERLCSDGLTRLLEAPLPTTSDVRLAQLVIAFPCACRHCESGPPEACVPHQRFRIKSVCGHSFGAWRVSVWLLMCILDVTAATGVRSASLLAKA